MNIILKRTHMKSNIKILKARDYYFDIAKKLNRFKTAIVLFPSFFMLITYLLPVFGIDLFSDELCEIIIGIMAAAAAASVYLLDALIGKYTDISNHLRLFYDHNVLGVHYNPYLFPNSEINKYLDMAKKVKDSPKYEVWYSEVFAENHYANVFCCQMDNLLYAKHAYKKTKEHYLIGISIFTVSVVFAILISILAKDIVKTLLIIFSVLEFYDVFIAKINDLDEALDVCVTYCEHAKQIRPCELDEVVINQTQDIVNQNRALHIFLPSRIRKLFLEDGNPFYRELDQYKHKFMGEQAVIPERAEDIDIMFEDGSNAVPLCEVHNRLYSMMKQVADVLDNAGIEYFLDGETLIGTMRNSLNGFIPWDDNVDIAIPFHQIEKAKKALSEHLDYVIQDAENEPFYSPRLSAFKIREPNHRSMVSEKDSSLSTRYQNKGLFIDVYAYSPILVARPIDAIFRRLFIHPLNHRLETVDNNFGRYTDKQQIKKFFKLKKHYLKVLDFYKKYAKNEKYLAYFPGYICNLSKAGPYLLSSALFEKEHSKAFWISEFYKIPKNPDAVLFAYYGDDWKEPPYLTKSELIDLYPEAWYNKAPTKVTALKHISNLLFYQNHT